MEVCWNKNSVAPLVCFFNLCLPKCERTFSSAKVMIISHRNNLSDEVLEASKCLRAWFSVKLGVIFRLTIDCKLADTQIIMYFRDLE